MCSNGTRRNASSMKHTCAHTYHYPMNIWSFASAKLTLVVLKGMQAIDSLWGIRCKYWKIIRWAVWSEKNCVDWPGSGPSTRGCMLQRTEMFIAGSWKFQVRDGCANHVPVLIYRVEVRLALGLEIWWKMLKSHLKSAERNRWSICWRDGSVYHLQERGSRRDINGNVTSEQVRLSHISRRHTRRKLTLTPVSNYVWKFGEWTTYPRQ